MKLEVYDSSKKHENVARLFLKEEPCDNGDINIEAWDDEGENLILCWISGDDKMLHLYDQAGETDYGFKLNKKSKIWKIWIEEVDSE